MLLHDEATHRQKGMSIGAGSFCFYFTAFSSLPAASAPHHQQTVNQRRREEPRALGVSTLDAALVDASASIGAAPVDAVVRP